MPDINQGQLNISPNATDEEKAKVYSDYFGLPLVSLRDKIIDFNVFSKIPYEVVSGFDIIPYEFNESSKPAVLKIAVGDASKLQKKAPAILSELKNQQGINIELAVTTRSDFDYQMNQYKKLLDDLNKPKTEVATNQETDVKVKIPSGSAQNVNDKTFVDLKNKVIPYDTLSKFPEEVATRYKIVVFESPTDDKIKVAAINPDDQKVKDILSFIKNRNKIEIEVFKTTPQSLDWALRGYKNKNINPVKEEDDTIKIEPKLPPIKPFPTTNISVPITPSVGPIIAKPDVKIEPVKSIPLERIKNEKKDDVEKKDTSLNVQSKGVIEPINLENKGDVQEINIRDIKSSELRQGVGANENAIPLESVSTESEKNLDQLLPQGVKDVAELELIIKGGFIPKTLAAIVYLATMVGASDIHIEAEGKFLRLRYRIDGILKDILKLPLELQAPVISRIKILSKLKIDEQRIPQDGRFEVLLKGRDIDLRVSTLPTVHGEKAVMRILDKSSQVFNMKDLGVTGNALKALEDNIKKPYGVILSTGPTGSGKTTTLYAIINKINKPEINVITLEDPVEYEIPGINQCQIKPKIGFGFAEGLRSVLRQDPNVIMVGEIRDQETASMATHAALTGHLVLTTLHTNDAASALPRLINMGVEPFLITSAINCIVAQRLVRKICQKCKEEQKIPDAVITELKKEIDGSNNPEFSAYKNKEMKFYHGKGCPECTEGFKGRLGIFEVLNMSDKIEDLAVGRAQATVIKEQAIKEGMLTMKEDGIIKALNGLTTIDEILRVTSQ